MIPGEYEITSGDVDINAGRQTKTIRVANTGDRPIQVGSHYHIIEANRYLSFPREETVGMQLNIPSGTAVRFEPGEEKEVELTDISGLQNVFGLNDLTHGSVDNKEKILKKADQYGFKGVDTE
ncbi:urease subunit beta [Salicibibacter kimchii]|uniref:Urease subunit beta n=1 Tax=Salicibibacter kimchii TaxID=2099786 RepID=A0A345C0J7_9BACI|nr:urease subunit beta [Salicibibacter kimchii]AXF56728.1 urease subunit beta [Salicibibacter kimchii]